MLLHLQDLLAASTYPFTQIGQSQAGPVQCWGHSTETQNRTFEDDIIGVILTTHSIQIECRCAEMRQGKAKSWEEKGFEEAEEDDRKTDANARLMGRMTRHLDCLPDCK